MNEIKIENLELLISVRFTILNETADAVSQKSLQMMTSEGFSIDFHHWRLYHSGKMIDFLRFILFF
jgi:hypothetical protein